MHCHRFPSNGGVRGGEIVAAGTPEQVAVEARSYTGGIKTPPCLQTRSRRLNPLLLAGEVDSAKLSGRGKPDLILTRTAPLRIFPLMTALIVIDLGPEGCIRGGEIVAVGTPEAVAKEARSYTGGYLRSLLRA